MKFTTTLLFAGSVTAAVLDARQAPAAKAAAKSGVYDTRTLAPKLSKTAKRTVYRFGPLNLKPGGKGRSGFSMDPNGQTFTVNIPKGAFCKSCTILAARAGLEFQDGSQADVSKGVYVHHILASNSKKKVVPFISQCDTQGDVGSIKTPSGSVSTSFAGVSDDNGNEPVYYTTRDGSHNYGYHVSEDNTFGIVMDLVNYKPEEQKVYLTYDLEYVDGKVGTNSQGTLLSVTGCLARSVKTAANTATNTTSGKYAFFRDGVIVNAKGHLHDGGVQMDMYINDKYICSSKAIYGGPNGTLKDKDGKVWETISEMTGCPGPIPVKKGDSMKMIAQYDLKKHPLRAHTGNSGGMAEVMGMWAMTFSGA